MGDYQLRQRRELKAAIVMGVVAATTLLLVACGGGGSAESDQDVQVDFPYVDGAERIDAAQIDNLPFAAQDAVAAVHLVDEDPMTVNSYYQTDVANQGWNVHGGSASEYIAFNMLTKDDRIAVLTMMPGVVLKSDSGILEEFGFDALEIDADGVGDRQTLIFTQLATCTEDVIDDCVNKAFQSIYPRVVATRSIP